MGGWKTSYGKNTPTGETMQMTYEAGAVLQNLEFARVWNMPRLFGWEGQTVLMPLGARFVNAEGEPFMERYSPVLGSNTDPHYTTMAMAMEIRAGRGPITFDLSRIQQENLILLRPQNGWQKLNYDKLSALGLDLFRDSTEWVPQMTVSYGGLRADAWGNTNLEGLLAAGTARATEPGVYAGGFALMTTSVLGHMAGENAARLLQTLPEVKSDLSDAEITARQQALFAPLGKEGLTPKEVLTSIQKTVFPYGVSILKTNAAFRPRSRSWSASGKKTCRVWLRRIPTTCSSCMRPVVWPLSAKCTSGPLWNARRPVRAITARRRATSIGIFS